MHKNGETSATSTQLYTFQKRSCLTEFLKGLNAYILVTAFLKFKGGLTKYHTMNIHKGVDVRFLKHSTRCVRFTLRPLYPAERAHGAHLRGGWIVPRDSLNAETNKQIPAHAGNQTPAVQTIV